MNESDEEEPMNPSAAGPGGRPAPMRADAIFQLLQFLHQEQRATSTNEELINSLRSQNTIENPRVERAMRVLSRGLFVPEAYIDEAFVDNPLRVVNMSFNISAPHMYGMCLEALNILPGNDFLDIGSGCGHMTALGAILAGPTGTSLGLEIREDISRLGRTNVQQVLENPPEGLTEEDLEALRRIRFKTRNCFLPDPEEELLFDRIHVGASCPTTWIGRLTALLKPGGSLVSPCGEEMQVHTKSLDGNSIDLKVLAHVRYGELVLPSAQEIKTAIIAQKRTQARTIKIPPPSPTPAAVYLGISASLIENFIQEDRWRHPKLNSDLIIILKNSKQQQQDEDFEIRYYVHRSVLARRADHFKALFDSGMKDSASPQITITDLKPHLFEQLLEFLYLDQVEVNEENAVALLEISCFYQVHRLIAIVETFLRNSVDVESVCEILEIADAQPAFQLKQFCLSFIVDNFSYVRLQPSFGTLSKELLVEITAMACSQLALVEGRDLD